MIKLRFSRYPLFIAAALVLLISSCTKTNSGSGSGSGSGSSTTSLVYTNDAFTPIVMTINDSTATIPVGGSLTLKGKPGASVTGQAVTSGLTSSGATVGSLMSWPISDVFPSSGSTTKTLDVGPSYFFLKIDNTSAYSVTGVYVNYGLVPQTYDAITFGSGTFNIGYYAAYTNTDIRCISGAAGSWQINANLSMTQNQTFLFTLTN